MILGDSYGQNSGHNHLLQKRVLGLEEEELWASGPTSSSGTQATVAKLRRPHDSNRRFPRSRCQQDWPLLNLEMKVFSLCPYSKSFVSAF